MQSCCFWSVDPYLGECVRDEQERWYLTCGCGRSPALIWSSCCRCWSSGLAGSISRSIFFSFFFLIHSFYSLIRLFLVSASISLPNIQNPNLLATNVLTAATTLAAIFQRQYSFERLAGRSRCLTTPRRLVGNPNTMIHGRACFYDTPYSDLIFQNTTWKTDAV